jgi:hypothetical protein
VSVSFAGTAAGMAVLLAMTFRPSSALLVLFVVLFGLCMGTRGPDHLVARRALLRRAARWRRSTAASIRPTRSAPPAGALTGGALHDLTGGYRAGLAIALVFIASPRCRSGSCATSGIFADRAQALLALAQRAAAQVDCAFLGHDYRRLRSSA